MAVNRGRSRAPNGGRVSPRGFPALRRSALGAAATDSAPLGAQSPLDHAFDVAQVTAHLGIAEGECHASGSGPRRSPDAVDVAFGLVGKLVVDDVGDVVDVDAPGGDVGRHQDAGAPAAKPFEGALASALGLVAVDRLGGDAAFIELRGDTVGPMLGAREDENSR